MVNRLISLNRRREAVGVLCKYCHSATELVAAWYTHLPSLMRSYPVELTNGLVKCMMKDAHAGRPILLEVDRLLPILLNYEVSFNEDGSTENRVLYFLEHCIFRFDYPSPAVHNYYIYLLAKEKDEERLYEALTSSLFYDPEYALRVCVERGCKKVSFTLYKKLELYEHALRYLLENSEPQQEQWRELTFVEEMLRGLALKLSHDRAKNLWLLATGYSFRKQGSKSVPQIIEHSGGLLGIEDVLQFYDNHMVVAEFKGVIQKALNQYTQDIASLNQRQKEVYETAERVKQDIASLQQQTEQVPPDATCHLCQRRINSAKSRPYVVYPGCNHIVHEGCAKKRLQNTGGLEAFVTDDGISPQLLEDVQTVTDLVYFDCVVCGEASIVELDIPLCHPDGSWDI
ncbi:hypothetical protein AGDE_09257 [Angomonas deanei]|nr:hypothetical protein AGDE_09257 [Angomonas deanei]|eukprot:EPY30805.1 hypothetical protein AGDE_09257 [Angomonas deanei]